MRARSLCGFLLLGLAVLIGPPAVAQIAFSNPAPITIPEAGPAASYPSTLSVAGFPGTAGKVTLTLNGLSHAWPDDLDVLLVGPKGQSVLLMSDAGGSAPLDGVDLTFDDDAPNPLPDAGPIASGTYRPSDDDPADAFPAPAPSGGWGDRLSVFSGLDPNGTWSLYIFDDQSANGGTLTFGWTLTITPCVPGPGGSLHFTTQPGASSARVPLAVQPVVTALDTCGKVKTSYNGLVSLSLAPDAGTKGAVLTGGTTVQARNGVATFSGLSVDRPGIGYVLLATAEGYLTDRSAPFDMHPFYYRVRPAAQGGLDANDGLSWETAKATVQAAIDAAVPTDEIWVAEGTYTQHLHLKSGVTLYGGFSGTEESRDERDPSAHETVLDGGGQGSVVSVGEDVVQEAAVDGFTIQHGSGRAVTGGSLGGGIDCYEGNLRLVGCLVRENVAVAGLGGGLFVEDGRVTLVGNTFTGNRVSAGPSPTYDGNLGSALFGYGLDLVLVVTGNTFTGNTAADVTSGESIFVTGGTVTLTGNRIQDNSGGVDIGTADLVCTDNLFQGNGYGIRASGGSHTALIARNRVVGNWGRGISCDDISATVQYNTVTDNISLAEGSTGSGIYANASSTTITIENNLIARNRAYSGGGLEAQQHGQGTLRILNNTVVNNTAETISNLYVNPSSSGQTLIVNNIVAFGQSGRPLGGGFALQNVVSSVTIRNNDLYGNTPTDYVGAANPIGTNGNISEDPLFADRANGNYRLLSGSPSIDAGDDTYVTTGDVDLDGKPRRIGAHVDMGAYEFLPGGPFSWAEVLTALKAAGGLVVTTSEEATRLNVVGTLPARVDLLDAARLARKAAGLEPNP